MSIARCSTREQAERFRGMELRLPFEAAGPLPDGEYYHWQIIGLRVVTTDGQSLGKVVHILETGANDVYILRTEQGQEHLIPAIEKVIKRVDLVDGVIEIEPIPGLLHD